MEEITYEILVEKVDSIHKRLENLSKQNQIMKETLFWVQGCEKGSCEDCDNAIKGCWEMCKELET